MGHREKSSKRLKAKTILRLPDLEQSKNAVLNSLAAASSQESYGHAIDEFIGWYCSEPRLAFNRSVVLRYRFFLEQKNLAPSTINVRLAAVRRLAHEAADSSCIPYNMMPVNPAHSGLPVIRPGSMPNAERVWHHTGKGRLFLAVRPMVGSQCVAAIADTVCLSAGN